MPKQELPASFPTMLRLELTDTPLVGTSAAGQKIRLGGLSGLRYLGRGEGGKLRFLSHTDRGPNADEIKVDGGGERRPFALPGFQPRILLLEADLERGFFRVEREIPLYRPDGKKLSGLPQKVGQEQAVSLDGRSLPLDPYGMDLEGIAIAGDGSYWMVDEYGPSVVRFSAEGRLLEVLKPGSGLPIVLEQRRLNRGFEGLALFGSKLYAILQSPLDNPRSENARSSKASRNVRLVEVDLLRRRTLGQYLIRLSEGDRIGDITADGVRSLLMIEQNGKKGAKAFQKVYRVNLEAATNLQLLSERVAGPGGALEAMSEEELAAAGIVPARKEELLDLARAGVREEKAEGLDLAGDGWLAVVTDNDFGLDGSWNQTSGTVGFTEVRPALYLFSTKSRE